MREQLKSPYTIDNVTRMVDVVVYRNGRKTKETEWEETMVVDSWSELLILADSRYADKNIRVVKKSDWDKGEEIKEVVKLRCTVCGKPAEQCMGECDLDTFLGII